MSSSALIFQTSDPRGLEEICTKECWEQHILDNHAIMAGMEEYVKETIQNPYLGFIYQDSINPNRNIYYLKTSKEPYYYVKVVVEITVPDHGEIITAFLTDGMKSGEIPIWPK